MQNTIIEITPDMKNIHTFSREEQERIFADADGDAKKTRILVQKTVDAIREVSVVVPTDECTGIPETEYTHLIRSFPPSVQEIASLFLNTFQIPYNAVPTPKNKSKFGIWIKQFEYLRKIGAGYASEAIPIAFQIKKDGNLTIGDPASINKIFQSAISDIRIRRKEMRKAADATEGKKSSVLKPDDKEMRNMRNKFK